MLTHITVICIVLHAWTVNLFWKKKRSSKIPLHAKTILQDALEKSVDELKSRLLRFATPGTWEPKLEKVK